jgi:signal transduction histidine kinase
MVFEFSALAAGLPMGASFAMAGGFVALRETRRRTSLNAALHELRRPLQALSLSLGMDPAPGRSLESSLEVAVAAVERLDDEINGRPALAETRSYFVRPVVEAAMARWAPVVSSTGRRLRLSWTGDDPVHEGDPIALAQAVDNLISNALIHGRGSIALEVAGDEQLLRLSVKDEGGGRPGSSGRAAPLRWKPNRDRRQHGHGLKIVRRAATRHGGSFRLVRSPGGTEASLVLPLGGRRA